MPNMTTERRFLVRRSGHLPPVLIEAANRADALAKAREMPFFAGNVVTIDGATARLMERYKRQGLGELQSAIAAVCRAPGDVPVPRAERGSSAPRDVQLNEVGQVLP